MTPIPPQETGNPKTFLELKNNDGAFAACFKQHFVPLCAYCQFTFNFDQDRSKDIVHTAFIRLWETIQFSEEDIHIQAYLKKIISNLSLDVLKHEKVKHKYADWIQANAETVLDFDTLEFKEVSIQIKMAIEDLPEQMRVVFEMSRYEGLKYAQIAERLNISVKTVETQMGRALARLRQKLAPYLVIFTTFVHFLHNS